MGLLECHHLASIIVIIHSGKKSNGLLKLLGESEMRRQTLHGLKVPPQKTLITEGQHGGERRNLADTTSIERSDMTSSHVASGATR